MKPWIPATPHDTSTDPKPPPTPPSVAGIGKSDDVAQVLARLTADNRALTDQVTRLQEDSRARLMLTRIRRILLLGDEVTDQAVVDEVDRVAKRRVELERILAGLVGI